jgi:hypothetical protein
VQLLASFVDKQLADDISLTDEAYAVSVTRYEAIGINAIDCLPGLSQGSIAWLPGFGPDSFGGHEQVCLVDASVAKTNGYSLGDEILFELARFSYGKYGELTYEDLGTSTKLLIIGTADLSTELYPVVMPFYVARAGFANHIDKFRAASASFYVNDSLRLNEFKEEMAAIKLEQVSNSEYDMMRVYANLGSSLLVNDAAFISSATKLQESISILQGFFPLVTVALASAGYLVAFLLIQNRRGECAIYRLIGLSKRGAFFLFFFELLVLTACGGLIGAYSHVVLGVGDANSGVLVFLLFSLCFLFGGAIALLRLTNMNTMLALAKKE